MAISNIGPTTIGTSVALSAGTLNVLSTVMDLREALTSTIQFSYQKTANGATSDTVKFYLIGSRDGTNFDNSDITMKTAVKEYSATAADTAAHVESFTLGGDVPPYAKLAVLSSVAGTLNGAYLTYRKAR